MREQMKEEYDTLYHMFNSWKKYDKFFPKDYLPKVEDKTLEEAYSDTKDIHKNQEFNDFYETLKMLHIWRGYNASALSVKVYECIDQTEINNDDDFKTFMRYLRNTTSIDGFFTGDHIGKYIYPLCYCIQEGDVFIVENIFKKIENISATKMLLSLFESSQSEDCLEFLYDKGGIEFFSYFLCNPLFVDEFHGLERNGFNDFVYYIDRFLGKGMPNSVLAIESVLCKDNASELFQKLWRAGMNTFMYRNPLKEE